MYRVSLTCGTPRIVKIKGDKKIEMVLTAETARIEGSGADQKTFPGDGEVTFKKDTEEIGKIPVDADGNAVLRYNCDLSRESSARIDAILKASDGQKASTSTRLNNLPTSRTEDDDRPGRPDQFNLRLEVVHQKDDQGVRFKLTARLRDKHGHSITSKPVAFRLDRDEVGKDETDQTGEAYFVSKPIAAEKHEKQIRLSARATVNNVIVVSNTITHTIPPAKSRQEEENFSYNLVIFQVLPLKVAENGYRFAIKARLTKVKKDESDNGTPVRNQKVDFTAIVVEDTGATSKRVDTTGHTDSAGEISGQTETIEAKEFEQLIHFLGDAVVNGKAVVSNTKEDKIPAATGGKKAKLPKALVVANLGRSEGNLYRFKVAPLSDPDDQTSATDATIEVYPDIPADFPQEVQTQNGGAVIEVRITKPGAVGNVRFGIKGTGVVSEPQFMRAKGANNVGTN